MEYLHKELDLAEGDVVEVTLAGNAANVLLLDDAREIGVSSFFPWEIGVSSFFPWEIGVSSFFPWALQRNSGKRQPGEHR